MKKRLYIYTLWVATCCVLLSTVVAHHHHWEEICTIWEQCAIDGQENDQHTEHHENEEDGCSLQQMRHFIINAKTVHAVVNSLIPAPPILLAVLPDDMQNVPTMGITQVCWQETATAIISYQAVSISHRGPPIL